MPVLPPDGCIRILIADDHRLFAESLMRLLGEDERIDVVGLAADGQQAVDLTEELQPDVILMDVNMPIIDGLEATRRICEASLTARILILTGADSGIGSDEAARAGASGFVRKENGGEDLKRVVLEVASLTAALGAAKR